MKTLKILVVALFIIGTSCNNEQDTVIPITPLIELEFTTPPFDLQGIDAQFSSDIAYDTDERTVFDIFIPNSATPTGLVIYIHPGSFTSGDKSYFYVRNTFNSEIREFLNNNIAVASINYRLLTNQETEGVIKSLKASKRALQYIRYIHKELNIDKDNIVLYGGSAGGGTALWLAANDEMREVNHPDPVLRESTRVKAVALNGTQSSYDIENRWINDVFSDFGLSWEETVTATGENELFQFYGVNSWADYASSDIEVYRKQVDMLSLLTADDPPIWVRNIGPSNETPISQGDLNHHPFHAREIKQYADAAGVSNICQYGNPLLYTDGNFVSYVDFLIQILNR